MAGTKRGQGVYEEISWEVAIREIAGIMKGIKEEYGNDAFYLQYGTGRMDGVVAKSWPPDGTVFARMMNCWGGYLRHYGTVLRKSDQPGASAAQRRRPRQQ